MLPREHCVERSRVIGAAPEVVFARIADLEGRVRWVPGLKSVSVESGGRFYTEVHGMGPLRMEILEIVAPERMVTRIADEKLEFGGTWTITVVPDGEGSKVSVREDGFVKSLLFRFFAKYVFGHTRTMDRFLAGLAATFSPAG